MTALQSPHNYVVMEFPSKPENVAFARSAGAMFASQSDFTLDELDDIKVAVSEAVSNAVIHAYPQRTGIVRIEFSLTEAGAFSLRVTDEGVGIEDVEQARQAQWTSQPEERMGLGFTFMQEYMDRLDVESTPGEGTRVTMSKQPAAATVPG